MEKAYYPGSGVPYLNAFLDLLLKGPIVKQTSILLSPWLRQSPETH